jgi:hypothetical protein
MEKNHTHPSMDQKIFDMDISVETISLYLLFCGLTDESNKITTNTVLDIWNGSQETLKSSIDELEKRNIIRKIISDDAGNNVYRVVSSEKWNL